MNQFYHGLIIIYLFVNISTDAQQVISSAGSTYGSENIHLSWTIGEPVIETLSGDFVLTQGFQQPTGTILYQLLNIPSGWSGISTYLNLVNPDFETIFQPYENDLIVLSSMSGIYYPAQSINTLGNWDYFEGYQVKAENEFSLNLAGHSFGDAILEVDAGWNLMPVLSRCSVPVEELFQEQESVIIAKEVAGSNIYWPAYGINTLDDFLPGKSYYVAFDLAETITFPHCAKAWAGTGNLTGNIVDHPWNEIDRTAGSHSIAVPAKTLSGSDLAPGDVIGAFAPDGTCAGVAKVFNPKESLAVTVYGNDELTPEKNGFYPGEIFSFMIYKPEMDQAFSIDVEYDLNLPQTGRYVPNGISAISSLKFGMISADTDFIKTLTLYPNPTTGAIYLKMNTWPGNLSVTITNAQQSLIAKYNPETTDLDGPLMIELGAKPNGVYFFTVSGDDFFDVRKVILH